MLGTRVGFRSGWSAAQRGGETLSPRVDHDFIKRAAPILKSLNRIAESASLLRQLPSPSRSCFATSTQLNFGAWSRRVAAHPLASEQNGRRAVIRAPPARASCSSAECSARQRPRCAKIENGHSAVVCRPRKESPGTWATLSQARMGIHGQHCCSYYIVPVCRRKRVFLPVGLAYGAAGLQPQGKVCTLPCQGRPPPTRLACAPL